MRARSRDPSSGRAGRSIAATLAGLLALAGCTTPPVHVPVPLALTAAAVLPGYEHVRYAAGGEDARRLEDGVAEAIRSAPPDAAEVSLLAISGGGERGAFAAGVLNGWSERGRPEFRVVSGVSVGALIAPLAFVGAEMDERMREAFLAVRNRDLFRVRSILDLPRADSLTRSDPLAQRLEMLIDDDVVRAVARGHSAGRRLYVLTTDFDAQRAVIWDMGAIAASGRPDATVIFRRVLLASAAVPVAFPPQYFAVEADGRRFDEMHVDGGLMTQVVLPLPRDVAAVTARPVRAWVIVNAKLEGESMESQPRLVPIATRSFQTMLRTQVMADARRIRRAALAAGVEFRLACIPGSFKTDFGQKHAGFDGEFMKRLFDVGDELGRGPVGFLGIVPASADVPE